MSASEKDHLRGYRGPCREVMDRFGITVWSEVTLETTEGAFAGLILPRSETSDEHHLVLKLDSGYNVGIRHDTVLGAVKTGEKVSSSVSNDLVSSILSGFRARGIECANSIP